MAPAIGLEKELPCLRKYCSEMLEINLLLIITARKRSLRRLCFHRCLSVHMLGLPHCMLRYTPRQTSPRQIPPPGRHPPPVQCMLGCGQQAGGTHLTGMQSCNLQFYQILSVIQSPKSFRGALEHINALQLDIWPCCYHSSIGLNRLRIQKVFSEVWILVTFWQSTHGCDLKNVTKMKKYLKSHFPKQNIYKLSSGCQEGYLFFLVITLGYSKSHSSWDLTNILSDTLGMGLWEVSKPQSCSITWNTFLFTIFWELIKCFFLTHMGYKCNSEIWSIVLDLFATTLPCISHGYDVCLGTQKL